jgi:hypothetical protein
VIDAEFTLNPPGFADEYAVDINGDSVTDYRVQLLEPACVRAVQISNTLGFSEDLPGMTVASSWNTVWELDATATEATTGASVRVLHGVRVLLTNAQKLAVCPA